MIDKTKEYVYILSNKEYTGKVKVGRTNKHPEIRAEQLNKQTANIGIFIVEWYRSVEDSQFYEKLLHYLLRNFHYKKEYFFIEIPLAIQIADKAISLMDTLQKELVDIYKTTLNNYDDIIAGFEVLVEISENSKDANPYILRMEEINNNKQKIIQHLKQKEAD